MYCFLCGKSPQAYEIAKGVGNLPSSARKTEAGMHRSSMTKWSPWNKPCLQYLSSHLLKLQKT